MEASNSTLESSTRSKQNAGRKIQCIQTRSPQTSSPLFGAMGIAFIPLFLQTSSLFVCIKTNPSTLTFINYSLMTKRACNMGVYDQGLPFSTWLCLDLYLFHVKYRSEKYGKTQQGNLLIWAYVCSCPWHSTWMMWFRNLSDCYSACELLLKFQTEHNIQHYSACAIVHILKSFQTSNMACVQLKRCFDWR